MTEVSKIIPSTQREKSSWEQMVNWKAYVKENNNDNNRKQ